MSTTTVEKGGDDNDVDVFEKEEEDQPPTDEQEVTSLSHQQQHSSSSLHRTLSRMPSRVGGFLLIAKPIQRQRWGDTQLKPHTDWGGLFFDLFFVAAAYNLANIIKQSPDNAGLLYFVACAGPVMQYWFDKMYYDSRFYAPDDVFHRFFEAAVFVTLGFGVLNIRPVEVLSNPYDNNEIFVFALAMLVGSVLTVLRYVEIMFWVDGQPVAKIVARRDILLKIMSIGFELAATIVAGTKFYGNSNGGANSRFLAADDETTYATTDLSAWLLVGSTVSIHVCLLVWMLSMPGGGRHKEFTVPMNIDFCIHRYGDFVSQKQTTCAINRNGAGSSYIIILDYAHVGRISSELAHCGSVGRLGLLRYLLLWHLVCRPPSIYALLVAAT
jgi:hypothetical protein